jgi:hypothetical protein
LAQTTKSPKPVVLGPTYKITQASSSWHNQQNHPSQQYLAQPTKLPKSAVLGTTNKITQVSSS